MKKIFATLLILQFSALMVFAQKGNYHKGGSDNGGSGDKGVSADAPITAKKFNIEINIGGAVPTGQYSSQDMGPFPSDTTTTYGWARSGFHFDIGASYLFSKYVGAAVMIGGNVNSFDNSAWEIYRDTKVSGTITWTHDPYYFGEYLVGPYISVPLDDRWSVDVKALFGLATSSHPTLNESYISGYNYVTESFYLSPAVGFGYNFSAGIKYRVTDLLGLNFGVGYGGTNVGYQETVVVAEQGYPSYTETFTDFKRHMTIGVVQIKVGVSLYLF